MHKQTSLPEVLSLRQVNVGELVNK